VDAESTLCCRHYFKLILEDQLIISVLDCCYDLIFESHGVLGGGCSGVSVLQ
jgi:hypothetical protein